MGGLLILPILLQLVEGIPLTTSEKNDRDLFHLTENGTNPFHTLLSDSVNNLERSTTDAAPSDEVASIITTMTMKILQIEDDQKEIKQYLNQIETLLKLKLEHNKSSDNSKPVVPYIKYMLNTSAVSANTERFTSETSPTENGHQALVWKQLNEERYNDRLFAQL